MVLLCLFHLLFLFISKGGCSDSTHVQVCHHDTYPCWDFLCVPWYDVPIVTNPTCPFSFITSLWTIFLSGFSTGLSPVSLACSCPNYAPPSLDPWDCRMDCLLCPLHVPVPTIHPLPYPLHCPLAVLLSLACSCPTYPSPFLDPWDCRMDCLLCPLHVPVPTINSLPLIHGIVPWTVLVSLACSCPNYQSPSLDPWDCSMDCLLCPCVFPSQLSIRFP